MKDEPVCRGVARTAESTLIAFALEETVARLATRVILHPLSFILCFVAVFTCGAPTAQGRDEPLSCEALGGLLREALAASAFEWQVCEASARPGILAWQAADIAVNGFPVSRAAFYYEQPELDWPALAGPRRLTVLAAKSATAEFRVRNDDLAARLQKTRPRLADIRVETTAEQIGFAAAIRLFFGLKIPLAMAGRLTLQGRRLSFHPDAANIWRFTAPKFVLRRLDRWLNPVAEIDLSAFALEPTRVRLLPAPGNAVAIIAQGGG